MAQVFEDKDMKGEERLIHDDPQHHVKGQIENAVGTIDSQPLFDGANGVEKLTETRVGETLLTDNVQKLDSIKAAPMDIDEATPEGRGVKMDVAETSANDGKEERDGSGEKKEESVSDDGDSVKSGSSGDDSPGTQEQQGMKFKKLSGAGIPRGKPYFRMSANHGNRGLGDNSLQSGGLGGLRGVSRGGLARTGSGLARTGSGIPQGNSDLKDFSAALSECDSKSSDSLPPSTDAKLRSHEKQSDTTMPEKVDETKDPAADKLTATREATVEKSNTAKDKIAEKATTTRDVVLEKAGDVKTGIVATLKDQLLPMKDSAVNQ